MGVGSGMGGRTLGENANFCSSCLSTSHLVNVR